MEITFEKLPQAVTQLFDKLENLERLILSQNNAPQPEEDKLLTIREAAEILHLTVPTVYGLVQRSEVPVCKRGKRLYFSKQELVSWIMSGRKKTIVEIDEGNRSIYSVTQPGQEILIHGRKGKGIREKKNPCPSSKSRLPLMTGMICA